MRFKLYRHSLHNSQFYKQWTSRLLDNEIKYKLSSITKFNNMLTNFKLQLKNNISSY